MTSKAILHLSLLIGATTGIVLNLIFTPAEWHKVALSGILGCLNGYHIYLFWHECKKIYYRAKIQRRYKKRQRHYSEWKKAHSDCSDEVYAMIHMPLAYEAIMATIEISKMGDKNE